MEGRVGVAELRKIQHQPVCIGGSHGWPGALHVLVYKKYAQQREEARGKEKVQPGDHRGVPNTGGMHVSQRLLECGMQVSVNKITFKRMANSDRFIACRRSRVSTSISCACGRFVSRCPRSWIPLPPGIRPVEKETDRLLLLASCSKRLKRGSWGRSPKPNPKRGFVVSVNRPSFANRARICTAALCPEGKFSSDGNALSRAKHIAARLTCISSRDSNGDGVISDSRAGRETGRRDRTPFC